MTHNFRQRAYSLFRLIHVIHLSICKTLLVKMSF